MGDVGTRIDSHQHFWVPGRNGCSWPPPGLAAIHRGFLAEDLAPLAADAGVCGTVLVQSQPDDRDTDFLLALAADQPLVKAVVGWVDMLSPAAPARIAQLATHPKLRGLRPMLQALPPEWILDDALEPAIDAMRAARLTLDALVLPRHLSALLHFAQRHPDLGIVIDHGAKPQIASRTRHPWQEDIAALAALPQIHCKLSGLVTEAAPEWNPGDITPYIEHLVSCFGSDRLMWGSDWPVLNLASDYQSWMQLAQDSLPPKTHSQIFGGTARRFYRIAEKADCILAPQKASLTETSGGYEVHQTHAIAQ